jgi:flagellar hook-associated protein 1 FlgK
VISSLGTKVQSAKFAAEFTSQVATSTESARSGAAGVNLDEEAARLLQFQQSYQASAKFLQIAQSTFDTLLQTVGR